MGHLFSPPELTAAGTDAAIALRLHDRLESRHAVLIEACQLIWDKQTWREANKALGEMGDSWRTFSAQIVELANQKASDPRPNKERDQQMCNSLEVLDRLLAQMETKFEPHLRFAGVPIGLQVQEKVLADAIAGRVKEAHDAVLAELQKSKDELAQTLKRLEGLQRDTLLAGSFGDHVRGLKNGAQRTGLFWLAAFMGTLGVAAIVAYKHLGDSFTSGWALLPRALLAIPVAVLVYFFFHEYKLQRIAQIKYEHLDGFVRGGAKEVAAMLVPAGGDATETTKALNQRLAEILLNTDDLTSATRRAGLPTKDLVKVLVEARKTVEAAGELARKHRG